MCGIVGTFGFTDPQIIDEMLRITAHRGPDERTTRFWDGLCGLGANRLSINDVAHGHQPFTNNRGDLHVVCNGEIYNAPALRQDLVISKRLQTNCDTEVIVHLYEEHGAGCLDLIDGMFAFIIYDEGNRTFFAARDRFGIKPLYYLRDEKGWHFASEAKAFLACGLSLENVSQLPPGCYMTEAGIHRYYALPPRFRKVEAEPSLVFSILEASVRRHLMADPDVGIGNYLSGGLDSSIIAAIASHYRKDLTAFTIAMPGSPDVANAERVCSHLGLEHVVVPFTLDKIWDRLPCAVYQMESYNLAIVLEGLLQMMLTEEVHKRGIKIMLSGEGADEIFAGYGVYRGKPPEQLFDLLHASVSQIHNTECLRVDRATMAHSVETRVPFLDPMVVDLALGLPASQLLRPEDGRIVEKWVLRKACEHLLPADLIWRMKLAFDQGSGVLGVLDELNAAIPDSDLLTAQQESPEARLGSKASLHLYRIFRETFGNMGGRQVFDLFGHYPILQDAIDNQTSTSGSTGEDSGDLMQIYMATSEMLTASGAANMQ